MKKRNLFYLSILLGIIFFVFRNWFLNPLIIGGDWPYYYQDFLKNFSLVPIIWQPWLGNGLGGIQPLLGLHVFGSSIVVIFHQWLQIPWNIVYKASWFGVFIALSVFGSKKLWEVAVSREQKAEGFPWWMGASLVYTTNTYILMVTGGGQMGVALSYALAPIVLAAFIQLIEHISFSDVKVESQKSKVKSALNAGLLLGVQLMIDPRIAYVTMVGVGIYVIANSKWQIANVISTLVVPLVVAVGINAFWALPMAVMRENPLGSLGIAYTSIESIKFFSFADFSHAIALLHPNWPENLFGKSYFLQPEFLILSLLAFGALAWMRQRTENREQIGFFALLALAGAFLAKGAQEPFGSVYQWMFTHVPGFVMFRDPTKFYVLIALAYSVLIPFTLKLLTELRMRGKTLLITLFILFWLFTTREAALGKLGGTFVNHIVPQEYRDLEGLLQAQPNFARTLWVPHQQRFSYGTLDHMPVEAEPLFSATTAAELKAKLDEPASVALLEDLGIGYVMIPYDSLGELFLTDRKYDEKKRQEYETVLDGVGWLTKIRFGNLPIYQTSRRRDLFWLSGNESLSYRRSRPDRYAVSFTVDDPGTVYFSQSYHQGWVFVEGNTRMKSERTLQGLNSFQILSPGTYDGEVVFEPQKYVSWGIAVSLLTVLGVTLVFML